MKTRTLLCLLPLLLAGARAQGAVVSQPVSYGAGDTPLRGTLAYDDSVEGRRPGILVVHEWWGLNDYARQRAKMLADLGYVALAVDMYGGGHNTEHPKEAGALSGLLRKDPETLKKRFEAALTWLRAQPGVDPARVAAIGYCFGGTVVLEMARRGVDLQGVVSFHGGLAPVGSPAPTGGVKAKVLVCHGAEDPLVKPEVVTAFQEEMRVAGADWQMNIYGGAKHAFTNPAADRHNLPPLAYNSEADHRSWRAMKQFLSDALGE